MSPSEEEMDREFEEFSRRIPVPPMTDEQWRAINHPEVWPIEEPDLPAPTILTEEGV